MKKIFIIIPILAVAVLAVFYFIYITGPDEMTVGLAGWRSSVYGYQQEQPPSYWIGVANSMSSKFDDFSPAGIWILGVQQGNACHLQFPGNESEHITFSSWDMNEEYLDAFDEAGVNVWLQVEPASADILELIDLVMSRYSHHPSVIGFGVDVEWLETDKYEDGRPVTSTEAWTWLRRVMSYNPDYKMFLKHWDYDKMPVSYTDDIVFITDSQGFASYDEMLDEFEDWGDHFSDTEVGFQYGYQSDSIIWDSFDDPAGQIGNDLIERIPNCHSLYWVDFTITDVFRP